MRRPLRLNDDISQSFCDEVKIVRGTGRYESTEQALLINPGLYRNALLQTLSRFRRVDLQIRMYQDRANVGWYL